MSVKLCYRYYMPNVLKLGDVLDDVDEFDEADPVLLSLEF